MANTRKVAATRTRRAAVKPAFNQADFVVEDLLDKNKQLTKENAILRAALAERDQFIQANADAFAGGQADEETE